MLKVIFSSWFLVVFIILSLWSLFWKGIALWKSGRNRQPVWFLFILIVNTCGLLPIFYLLFFQDKDSAKDKLIRSAKNKPIKKNKKNKRGHKNV